MIRRWLILNLGFLIGVLRLGFRSAFTFRYHISIITSIAKTAEINLGLTGSSCAIWPKASKVLDWNQCQLENIDASAMCRILLCKLVGVNMRHQEIFPLILLAPVWLAVSTFLLIPFLKAPCLQPVHHCKQNQAQTKETHEPVLVQSLSVDICNVVAGLHHHHSAFPEAKATGHV